MKSRHLLLTLLLLFGLSGVIHAENSLTLEDLGLPPLPDSSPSAVLKFEDAQKKALNGDAKAQFQLGWMYSKGQGVPKDNTEAVKWYRLAADQGGAGAQFRLGYMYAAGEGVPKNDIKAYVWYSLAKAQSYRGAVELIEMLKEDMSREQIAEGQALAARCSESNYKDCD